MRRHANPLATAISLLVVAVGAIAGIAIGLSAAGSEQYRTSVGVVSVAVQPARTGRLEVYVPLLDWRVRMHETGAPVAVIVTPIGIDRTGAARALSSSTAARSGLEQLREDVDSMLARALLRAAGVATVSGVIGGMLAGAVVAAMRFRRRWVFAGIPVGLVVSGLVLGSVGFSLRDIRDVDPARARLLGQADELPQLLRFSSQLLEAGDDYEQHYETALDSIRNLVEFAEASQRDPAAQTIVVASDLHTNAFVLESFDDFIGQAPVVMPGDFTQLGTRAEEDLAPTIGGLGGGVLAVSGNHDSSTFMRSLAGSGVQVLNRRGYLGPPGLVPRRSVVEWRGLSVAGYDDPLERRSADVGGHDLRVRGAEYERQVAQFLEWWDTLERRPDLLVVHQHGFAHRLVEHLDRTGDLLPLIIATGHDHVAHVHDYEGRVIVDGGTLGAGGPFAIGEQTASFVLLHLDGEGAPASADIISVEPLTSEASTRRIVFR